MKLAEISNLVGGLLQGDGEIDITGVAPLESAGRGEISFLANSRYHQLIGETNAGALLLPQGNWQVSVPHVVCKNPYLAFANVMQHFYGDLPQHPLVGIHSSAVIASDAKLGTGVAVGPFAYIAGGVRIGDNTKVYPGCFIGEGCQIGRDVVIYPQVVLRESCQVGDRVIIHPGAVIGSDGFGFAEDRGEFEKIPQIGRVVIEEDVEIGANACIDRATLGETRVHRGAKLDNLIQIAHNVEIGEHAAIAAQTGISGSTKVGKHSKLGGQVGLVGHITLGDHVICGAQAGVTKSHPDGTFLSGYPARPHKDQLKIEAAQSRTPELLKRLADLERRLRDLEGGEGSKA